MVLGRLECVSCQPPRASPPRLPSLQRPGEPLPFLKNQTLEVLCNERCAGSLGGPPHWKVEGLEHVASPGPELHFG